MLRLAVISIMGVIVINSLPPAIAGKVVASKSTLTTQFPSLRGITLSSTQEEKIMELANRTISEVETKLTAEQRQQIKTALAEGKDLRSAALSLNLSWGQKMSLRGTLQSMQSELKQILSSAQYDQLEQNVRNRMQNQ